MPRTAHEHTINACLGETLRTLRRSWAEVMVYEETGHTSQGRPDVIVKDASGWPVVIESERTDHRAAEADALKNFDRAIHGYPIESAIALVYPPEVRDEHYVQTIKDALDVTKGLEYCLFTRGGDGAPIRTPERGWIRGGVRDLALLVHRATTPAPRVERLAARFEEGIALAERIMTDVHGYGDRMGVEMARALYPADDDDFPPGLMTQAQWDRAEPLDNRQTRCMGMTVLVNALMFHETLAKAKLRVEDDEADGGWRDVRYVEALPFLDCEELRDEWRRILRVNYWPIFDSAIKVTRGFGGEVGFRVVGELWRTAKELVDSGVTRSHDLTGKIFQRLIEDREYLATHYTQPPAAALLAGLALPLSQPIGGADWGDSETLAAAQIGDFACGSGTLLSAAYQRIAFFHEMHDGDAKALHAKMMQHGLVGIDIVHSAVHLTATMLAGAHPDTTFDGECLLKMPYGGDDAEHPQVGSLELLSDADQPQLIGAARAAINAQAMAMGGTRGRTEDVRQVVQRVRHHQFDLVIMNPPFTRPTNHENKRDAAGRLREKETNPAYAGLSLGSTPQERSAMQRAMGDKVKRYTKGAPSNDYAGLASHFVELARRKVRTDGTVALVLPLSAMSGKSWERVRKHWRSEYQDIVVVTIAGEGDFDKSFSQETGMADCLVVGRRLVPQSTRMPRRAASATFVSLHRAPRSAVEGELLANEIIRMRDEEELPSLEGDSDLAKLIIGATELGNIWTAGIPDKGVWPSVGIRDSDLAQTAMQLAEGKLVDPRSDRATEFKVVPLERVARVGPVDRLIGSSTSMRRGALDVKLFRVDEHKDDQKRRRSGAGVVVKPAKRAGSSLTHPVLWRHHHLYERMMTLQPDAYGERRGGAQIPSGAESAFFFNRDFHYNAQSVMVGVTERPCIGGRAWPAVTFDADPDRAYAFALWCNSTLGLLMHWWFANKTQAGRGSFTVSKIPSLPVLDVAALSPDQHAAAKAAFEELRERPLLPVNQIDEDAVRAEIDRRLIVGVLGMDGGLCAPNGPIDLLRRKLAVEPQIAGKKRERVVFTEETRDGASVIVERVTRS